MGMQHFNLVYGIGLKKMRLNDHHIKYKEKDGKDWILILPWFLHRPLNVVQRWMPHAKDGKWLEFRYSLVVNLLHAL